MDTHEAIGRMLGFLSNTLRKTDREKVHRPSAVAISAIIQTHNHSFCDGICTKLATNSRDSTLRSVVMCHLPPRAAGTPREFNFWTIWRNESPWFCNASMCGTMRLAKLWARILFDCAPLRWATAMSTALPRLRGACPALFWVRALLVIWGRGRIPRKHWGLLLKVSQGHRRCGQRSFTCHPNEIPRVLPGTLAPCVMRVSCNASAQIPGWSEAARRMKLHARAGPGATLSPRTVSASLSRWAVRAMWILDLRATPNR